MKWKQIEGYEFYEVSDSGLIRHISHTINTNKSAKIKGYSKHIPGRMMKLIDDGQGYRRVTLSQNGHKKTFDVHRIVASAFIQNPDNKRTVNHKNLVKHDNRVSNLEWASDKENIIHAIKNGANVARRGSKHGRAKLKEADVCQIRKSKEPAKALSERYHVASQTIYDVKNKKKWAWLEC